MKTNYLTIHFPHFSDGRQCTLMSVKFDSVASSSAFVIVLLMDKDKNEGVISGVNYHFHYLYLFICLCLVVFLSLYGNMLCQ